MRVGEYKSLRELRRSGAASLWEVEGAGANGAARLAAKVLQPPAFWSDEERAQRVARFLARAGVQRSAAAAGGAHWAPIRAAGEDEHGAYYVTDLYPSSAEQLIRTPKARVDGAGLYRIVRGVVAGLAELREGAGRGHGRLAPGNVLLTSENPGAASVALADPAIEPPDGEGADCRAVGELIFALVQRRMPQAEELAGASGAWRALGPRGARWRELCNRLLDPAAPLESLDELRAEVERCRPPKVSKGRAVRVAVALALLVGAVMGFLAYRVKEHRTYVAEWAALCDAGPWFEGFVNDVGAGGNLTKLIDAAPPALKNDLAVLRDRPEVNPQKLRGGARPAEPVKNDPPSGSEKVNRVKAVVRGLRAVERLCSDDGWPPLGGGKELASWYGPEQGRAGKLAASAHYVAESPGATAAPKNDGNRLVANLLELIRYRSWIEPLRQLGPYFKPILAARAEDPELAEEFARASDSAFAYDVDNPKVVQDLLDQARAIAGRLDDLKSVDVGRFRSERARDGKTGIEFLKAWLAQVGDYRRLRDDENPLKRPREENWRLLPGGGAIAEGPAVPWDKLLEGIPGDIRQLESEKENDLAQWGRAREGELRRQLADLEAIPPLVKNREKMRAGQDEFVKAAGEVRRALAKDNPAFVKQFVDERAAEIARLDRRDFVQDARAVELRRLVDSNWRLGRKKAWYEAVDRFFRELPQPPRLKVVERQADRAWAKDLAQAARAQWEKAVRAALPRGGQPQDAAGLMAQSTRAREQVEQWASRAEQLGTAAAALEDRLNEYPLPDDAGGGRPSVKALRAALDGGESDILKALAPVTGRADALIGVAKQPVEQLRKLVAEGKLEDVSPVVDAELAAWRLGADRSVPLGSANAAREKLIARLKQGGGGKAPPAGVFDEVDQIWRERVARPQVAAPPAARVSDVLAEADRLLKEPSASLRESDLDAPGLYNLAVYRLVQAVKDQTRDAELEPIRAAAERAARNVRGVGVAKAGDRAQDALAEFLKRLDKSKPDASAVPIERAGPGGAGWEYVQGSDLVYTKGKLRLEFVLVEAPGAECYLSKTEVSIELVNEVLTAMDLRVLSRTVEGPQLWALRDGGKLEAARDWFPDLTNGAKAYKPAAADWVPGPTGRSLSYPMQWVAPAVAEKVAAALKCKLPTVGQWQAALKAELSANPATRWNLRDRVSWQAEVTAFPRNARVGNTPGEWAIVGGDLEGPKSGPGEFWKAGDPAVRHTDGAAPRLYDDDGHLFFQTVDLSGEPSGPWAQVGRGQLFDHLIGNVAEYVVDPGNRKGKYLAIGGSAVSPPLPVDEPIPLDRDQMARGYCDLGFRLALDPPVARLWKRLQVALGDPAGCFITRTQ